MLKPIFLLIIIFPIVFFLFDSLLKTRYKFIYKKLIYSFIDVFSLYGDRFLKRYSFWDNYVKNFEFFYSIIAPKYGFIQKNEKNY